MTCGFVISDLRFVILFNFRFVTMLIGQTVMADARVLNQKSKITNHKFSVPAYLQGGI